MEDPGEQRFKTPRKHTIPVSRRGRRLETLTWDSKGKLFIDTELESEVQGHLQSHLEPFPISDGRCWRTQA